MGCTYGINRGDKLELENLKGKDNVEEDLDIYRKKNTKVGIKRNRT